MTADGTRNLEVQNNIRLMTSNFWKLACMKTEFPLLNNSAIQAKSYFGSIHLCELMFSTMNTVKKKKSTYLTCLILTLVAS